MMYDCMTVGTRGGEQFKPCAQYSKHGQKPNIPLEKNDKMTHIFSQCAHKVKVVALMAHIEC